MNKKADSKVKLCLDCNVDISDRGGGAKRCAPCAVSSPKKQAEERRSERSLVRAQKEYVEEQKRIIRAERAEKAEAVEKMLKVKLCMDCGVDISDRKGMAKRCLPCANIRSDELKDRARERNAWKYTVTGDPEGITKKQYSYIQFLVFKAGGDESEILKQCKDDRAIIFEGEDASCIEELSVKEASDLIEYIKEIKEYASVQ